MHAETESYIPTRCRGRFVVERAGRRVAVTFPDGKRELVPTARAAENAACRWLARCTGRAASSADIVWKGVRPPT